MEYQLRRAARESGVARCLAASHDVEWRAGSGVRGATMTDVHEWRRVGADEPSHAGGSE